MQEKNSILERLHFGLDKREIPKRGRNPIVAEKTGYSPGMVAKLLSGHAVIGDRFIQAISSAFDINKEWLVYGCKPQGSILTGEPEGLFDDNAPTKLPPFITPPTFSEIMDSAMIVVDSLVPGLGDGLKDNVVREGIKELIRMPDVKRWKAVTILKEMNSEEDNNP